jgi:hypothetical protein
MNAFSGEKTDPDPSVFAGPPCAENLSLLTCFCERQRQKASFWRAVSDNDWKKTQKRPFSDYQLPSGDDRHLDRPILAANSFSPKESKTLQNLLSKTILVLQCFLHLARVSKHDENCHGRSEK